MSAPDRRAVENICGHILLEWQWNAFLGILGHLPTRATHPKKATEDHPQNQDWIKRTCVICGRVGTRRYIHADDDGTWQCSPTATKCPGNQPTDAPAPADQIPSEPCLKPEPPQVNTLAEPPSDIRGAISTPNVTPAAPPTPGVTARCQDCTRTWNITGRPLQQAVELHELKHGHIVTIYEVS